MIQPPRAFIALAAAALLLGCGDPLARGDYPGEPLLRVSVVMEGTRPESLVSPKIGLVWVDLELRSIEDITVTVPVTAASFPGDFTFDVFEPPPASRVRQSGGAKLATGALVALDDVDQNDDFDFVGGAVAPPDVMFGESWTHGLLFAELESSARDVSFLVNEDELRDGYQLVSFDWCNNESRVSGPETRVTLNLFVPSPDVPRLGPSCVEPGPCEIDFSSEACSRQIAWEQCRVERCGDPLSARDECAIENCGSPFAHECMDQHCGSELAALQECTVAACGREP